MKRPQGLKSAEALAADKPHGIRLRYLAGCRCDLCRRANTDYELERARARKAGDWNGLVDAREARLHLRKLSRLGVGRRAVHLATDIAVSIIMGIKRGARTRIRARTARKILAVTPAQRLDGALVPAGQAWQKLHELEEEGYDRKTITSRLGLKTDRLQFGRASVTVRNAGRIARVHRQLTE